MLTFKNFITLFKVENLIDKHIDELEFSNKDFFSKVITIRKEMASNLINDNETVNEGIRLVNELVRSTVEIAVDLLLNLQDIVIKKNLITKGVGAADFEKFAGALDRELEIAAIHNNERMWTTFGTSYGQGVERGLGDVGISSEGVDWQKYRETAAYKEVAYQSMRHISDGLSTRIKEVVAAGVAEGNGVYDIARRLREIKLGPKIVDVAPKLIDGKVVRRGYSYIIPEKRYANMIARTESSRAVNQGRLDAYNKTGIKNVEWLTAGDERVCDDCMDLDGRVFPINNMPMIPLHIACRCTIVVSGKITSGGIPKADLQVGLGDAFSSNYFPKGCYGLTKTEFKKEVSNFVVGYKDLDSLGRKKVLRSIVGEFKKVSCQLKMDPTKLNDLGYAFHLSKSINKLDGKVLKLINEARGTKQTLLYIGENKGVKAKWVNNIFRTEDISNHFLVGISPKNKNCFGATFSSNMTFKNGRHIRDFFKLGEQRNLIRLENFNHLMRTDSVTLNLQLEHAFVHELGHTIENNILLLDKKVPIKKLYLDTKLYYKADFVTPYSKGTYKEFFCENFAAQATGSNKVPQRILDELEKILYLAE